MVGKLHYTMDGDPIQANTQNDIIAEITELQNKLDNFEINASKIILNMDILYCSQVINKMDNDQIKVLMKHLHGLQLTCEKVLFDRT